MNWLTQNWPWLLFAVGALFLLGRGASHRRRGYGHHGGYGGSLDPGDLGHGGHAAGRADQSALVTAPMRAIDPVTRKDVSPEHALTSIHQGRIYYFETAESRQRFEASPEQYAREEFGHSLSPPQGASEPRRRRRGGC